MKASDLDKEPSHPEMPTAREWLRVIGAAVAIVADLRFVDILGLMRS